MKTKRPNFVIVAPRDTAPDAADPQCLARILARDGWVYFAELNREDVEDDEHGVRFLGWQDTLVDHFGSLDAVVVIDDRKLAKKLSKRRLDVPVIHWERGVINIDRKKSETDHPLSLVECFNRASPLMPVVERCAFAQNGSAA